MTTNSLEIKVALAKELAKKFLKIKSEYGLRNNSETVRLLINREYKRLFIAEQ